MGLSGCRFRSRMSAIINQYLPESIETVSSSDDFDSTVSSPGRNGNSTLSVSRRAITENSQASKRTDKIADANCRAKTWPETERMEPVPSNSQSVSLSLNLQSNFAGMPRHLSSIETAVSLEQTISYRIVSLCPYPAHLNGQTAILPG